MDAYHHLRPEWERRRRLSLITFSLIGAPACALLIIGVLKAVPSHIVTYVIFAGALLVLFSLRFLVHAVYAKRDCIREYAIGDARMLDAKSSIDDKTSWPRISFTRMRLLRYHVKLILKNPSAAPVPLPQMQRRSRGMDRELGVWHTRTLPVVTYDARPHHRGGCVLPPVTLDACGLPMESEFMPPPSYEEALKLQREELSQPCDKAT
ncbi:unnamed protein product [Darwinula stevensoni]|uniref:Uncharacterized protein n=1 Tax=Darwinula stevensoni TaxID=69355 RepID=A0A7R9FRQ5_9CRUS|nr:unnamed protein product [Darwinula stevensoni]CAG0901459.1 unnamed protein product [Darwinula stevensoni]